MPLPDPTGYVPPELTNPIGTSTPPDYILQQMIQGGFADAQGNINPAYRWNPQTMSLESTTSGGGSYSYGDVADPSLGTNVVMGDGTTQNFAEGITPYTFLSAGPNYPGGYATVAEGSPEYNALRDDARTRNQQGLARIAALVGGGAALGQTAWGQTPLGGTTGTGTATATDVAYGATPAAGGGSVGFGTGLGQVSGAGLTPAATGSTLGSIGAAGAGTGLGAGLGTAAATGLTRWLPYINSGVNTLLGVYGSNQAADAEQAGLQAAIDEQRRQYDQNRQDLMPWLTAGQGALNNLQDPNAFTASPGYEWMRNEGQRDIGNSFAARGGAASGNALRALSEFNTGLAAQDYNNWWNRQAGLAGVGQNAAVNLGATGTNTAANVGNYLTDQGASRASGVLGKYGAIAGGLTEGIGNWLYSRRRRGG